MTLEDLEYDLARFIAGSIVYDNGTVVEIKAELGRVDALKIEMYAHDHIPPHFHVRSKSGEIDVKFLIEDCTLYKGELDRKNLKKIKAYFDSNKEDFWFFWENRTKKK